MVSHFLREEKCILQIRTVFTIYVTGSKTYLIPNDYKYNTIFSNSNINFRLRRKKEI